MVGQGIGQVKLVYPIMKHDSPMMKRIKQGHPGQQQVQQRPVAHSIMDKMVDGREFESLLSFRYEAINLANEIRKSIKEITDIRKKPLVCYVANVVKQTNVSVGIDGSDDLPFNEMIRQIPNDIKEIDIVLVTPGGFANQVAKFVNTLRPRFDKVSFILLSQSMSAGTIFALSGDEIIMRSESQIGPIDPQVRNSNGEFIPAQALRRLIDEIKDRGEECMRKKLPVPWTDLQILKNVEVMKELGNAISGSDYAIKLAEEYLNSYKFKTWMKRSSDGTDVTPEFKRQRSKEIASLLCDHSVWKSHGHAISREEAWNVCKLKIEWAENVNLEAAMRRMWALFYWIFDSQPIAKFLISENYCIVRNDKPKS